LDDVESILAGTADTIGTASDAVGDVAKEALIVAKGIIREADSARIIDIACLTVVDGAESANTYSAGEQGVIDAGLADVVTGAG
jgi:hypothetical protein